MDNKEFMLTTEDNPYNPYKQFDLWNAFDTSKRYIKNVDGTISTDCSSYLARIAITSDDMTDEENARARHDAIDEIIRLDPFDIYRKIYEDGTKSK